MTRSIEPILPGAALGVLGSGQLGRMFAIAARRMGYRVHTFSPDSDTPTGQVADLEVVAAYEDLDAVREFARGVKVVTFEFENVPAETAAAAEQFAPVRPGGNVLHTTQHRLREKTFLAANGFPVTPFRKVAMAADLRAAITDLGLPSILKTAGFGYDGKGQAKLTSVAHGEAVLGEAGGQEMVLETLVDFEREVSVVAARGADGSFAHWGVIENSHENHILDLSICPASVSATVAAEAVEIARAVLEKARCHRRAVRRIFPRPFRPAPRQRTGPAPAQQWTPHRRRARDQPVRATAPRGVRIAPRLHRDAPPRRDGEPARRPVGSRRTGLGRGPGDARCEAAPLWQE